MRIKVCPQCGSSNIGLFAGGISGTYKCDDCGYTGSLVIEKDFVKKG